MQDYFSCNGVSHSFKAGSGERMVLSNVSISLNRASTAVLLGPSGSGKTTLLSILGAMLSPVSGTVSIGGQPIDFSNRATLPRWRGRNVGFVFQQARLLPFLSVEDNLCVVATNAGVSRRDIANRMDAALDALGISDKRSAMPNTLSGGERQRVAIARAVIHRPAILLADEPTAALDRDTGRASVELLVTLAKQCNAVLLVVTHDERIVPMFDRALHLEDGRIRES